MAEIENSSLTPVSPAADNQTKSHQPAKKRRNLPGMPHPDAEVIALSPKTLMTTNRFVCEICNKGFQRDQNLQLHRRGHNLPWKLRQRTAGREVRKRAYVCPEPTCIHHDPSRALGDLTGIKKHFCRKHGDKNYKCERCSKKYAVQSDWKAHMKTCGTREYRCNCGTLFSRRDSFITHRAFCDTLAQEIARPQPPAVTSSGGGGKAEVVESPPPAASSPPPPPLTPSTCVVSPMLSIQSSAELLENQTANLQQPPPPPPPPSVTAALSTSTVTTAAMTTATTTTTTTTSSNSSSASRCHIPSYRGVFPTIFNASISSEQCQQPASYSGLVRAMAGSHHPAIDSVSLSLSSSLYGASPPLFQSTSHYASSAQPALSATALLQKAAEMGAAPSTSPFLHGLWLASPSPPDPQENNASTMDPSTSSTPSHANTINMKLENNSLASGLGLGLPTAGSSGFSELMMCNSTLFGSKPATLDLLGLGIGGGEVSSDGISAFLSSISGGVDMEATASFAGVRPTGDTWDEPSDRKPSML